MSLYKAAKKSRHPIVLLFCIHISGTPEGVIRFYLFLTVWLTLFQFGGGKQIIYELYKLDPTRLFDIPVVLLMDDRSLT